MRLKPERIATVPRYLEIKARILAEIRSGRLAPGDRLPNEVDLAERFGVSRMTANRAVVSLAEDGWVVRRRHSGTFVSDQARRPSPNPVLVLAQPEMVLKDEFFQTIYWQLRTHLAARGLPLQVAAPPPRDTVEWMLGLGAAPLIAIATPRYAYDDLLEVARRGLPTVAIASDVQGFGLYSVDADNLMGAALAVRHLSSLGHTRVAFVGGYPEESNSLDRERGYQTACTAAGLDADPRLSFMFPTDSFASSPETEARLRSALASKDRPTALFAAGPRLAMQALRTAADLGLRVPEDLSIVAFDDPPYLALSLPPLTTVRQPFDEMASCVAELVAGSAVPTAGGRRLFPPELVVRASTSAPPTEP